MNYFTPRKKILNIKRLWRLVNRNYAVTPHIQASKDVKFLLKGYRASHLILTIFTTARFNL